MKKIALVTGAAKRIGKEIALHLSSQGWQIAIHYHSSETQALSLLEQIPGSILVQRDLNDLKSIDSLFLEIQEKIGEPTLLVNNASIFERDQEQITVEKLKSHMNINCFAPILLSQKFCALSTKKKNIINIVDSFIHNPTKNFLSYNLSKMGLLYATKCLATQFAPHCRVNSISPGIVLEPEIKEEKEIFDRLIKTTHRNKVTSIKNILDTIDTILRMESMNGHDFLLDKTTPIL